MKTFSKVLSMILVGVMCFGLFAASAYASEFNFGDGGSDASFAQSSDFGADPGDSFSFGGSDNEFSFGGNDAAPADASTSGSEFSFGDPAAPAQAQTDTFQFEGEQTQTNTNDEFKFGSSDTETFDAPAPTNVSYSDFTADKNIIYKTYTDADASVTITATFTLTGDSFSGYAYSTSSTGANLMTISAGPHYKMNATSMVLLGSWLKTLSPNTYYFYGLRNNDTPVKMAWVTVNAGDYSGSTYAFSCSPTSYTKYKYDAAAIAASGSGIPLMLRYGVASITGSYTHILGVSEFTKSGSTVTLSKDYLDTLPDDTYYFIGFPSATDNSDYVKSTNTFIVKASDYDGSGTHPGQYTLSPDYPYAWTSGDDYLVFWSDMMKLRHDTKNHTIVLRYGYGAGSIPNKEVGVYQFWDFEDGTFALGTNFLNSLPSGTYTLQVVDMKPHVVPGQAYYGNCTNTVTFRIGAKLVPIDSDKHVINSIRNLRFLCDEPISQVYVGNIPLTYGEDYALSADRKTVTLSYEFLNKRSAGNTYTIKVLTTSGQYCSSTFQILTTAQGGSSPRTGDESNLGLWAAFLLLSGTAVVVLLPKLRKHDM